MQKLPYFFKFAGFPQIFRQCLYLWCLFLKYLVLSETLFLIEILRGEDPITGEDPFPGEDSFIREDSFTSIVRHERQGLAGSSSSSGRELRGIRASGGSMSGVSSSVWGLFHTQPRGGTGAPFRLDATVLLENMVLPRPASNEVSFLVLRFVVFCSSLDLFQHKCWNHFCYTVVVVLQVWECSSTARTLSLLMLEV